MTVIQANLHESGVQKVIALLADAGFSIEGMEGGGYVITSTEEEKPKRRVKPMKAFRTWLAMCKAEGVKPIPQDDQVFEYAERVKLPHEMLQLQWLEFKRRYIDNVKRYKDWPQVFRKSVEGNWFGLWALTQDGYILTTKGRQAQRDHQARGSDGHA